MTSHKTDKFVLESVSLKAIWMVTLFLTALVLVSWVIVGLLTNWDKVVKGYHAYRGVPTYPLSDKYPPYQGKPVLQVEEVQDFQTYKAKSMQRLNSYGYVDKAKGTVHIPVEAAMKKVLQRGLPARRGPE